MTACATLEQLEDIAAQRAADAALAAHVEGCAACRSALERIRANNAAVAEFATAASTWSEPVSLRPPGTLIEGYSILQELHVGGQGIVYKALHEPTRRIVALKVLPSGTFSTSIQRGRFEREIELVAHLQHPNIVTLYDSGLTPDGRLFFTMEYIHGLPLDVFFRGDGGPLAKGAHWGLSQRLALFCTLCSAVNHAHQRGVIHRDLKPGNILVDANGEPHILDFGLAKAPGGAFSGSRAPLTETGEFMGTLSYAAPEQLKGDPNLVDIRADVYSLGVILYELLTGRRPHAGRAQVLDLLQAVTDTDPLPPSRCAAEPAADGAAPSALFRIHDELDTIVMKALSRDRERRYHSAEALRLDLQRLLHGEPIEAKRDSAWYLLRKTAHRYRLALEIAGAFVVVLLVSSVMIWRQYTRAVEERIRADANAAQAERVVAFFDDLFRSANAFRAEGGTLGADVTLREVLELGAARLEQGLENEPLVRARLQETLGTTFLHLGGTDSAERLLDRAYATLEGRSGGDHPALCRLLRLKGQVALERGETDRAIQLHRRALAAFEAGRHPDERERATILYHLAVATAAGGDTAEAQALHEQVLTMRQRLLGPRHQDVADSLNSLGILDYALDRKTSALRHIRDAYEIRKAILDPDHPDRQESVNNLAVLLEEEGRLDEARQMYLEALASARKILGEPHPYVANILSNLAGLEDTLGQTAAAEANYREAIRIWRESRGADNPALLFNYAEFLRLHKRFAEAESQHRACLKLREAALPADHLDTARSRLSLAATLRELRQFDEAHDLVQRSLPRLEQADAVELRGVAELLMGRILMDQQRPREAEAWLSRSVGRFESDPSGALFLAEASLAWGQCLIALDKLNEAETVLERAVESFRQIQASARAREALELLLSVCEKLRHETRAEQLRLELAGDPSAGAPK